MKMKLGSMTFGEILDRGLKILFSRLPSFFALGALLLLPMLVVQLLEPQIASAAGLGASLILTVLYMVFSFVYAGAVVDIIAREYHGLPVSIGTAIGFAFKRLGPLILTALLTGIVIGIGLVLLVIPGIIFAVFFAFVTQVVMVERLSGTAAMSRSKNLTAGYRGRVFGILFVMGLLIGLINLGLTMGLQSVLPVQTQQRTVFGGLEYGPINYTNFIIITLVSYFITIFTSTFQSICTTLMYFDLRVRKEGYDLEVLAAQVAE